MNEGEAQPKKSPSMGIIVVGIIVIVFIAFFAFSYLLTSANRPNPDITMVDGHGGFQGLNYVFYVDVRVTNQGGEGWLKVYAQISGPRYEELNQRIYMDEGETKQLQFVFDVGLLDSFSSVTYKAWAVVE